MGLEALADLGEEPLAFLDVVGIEETDGAIETLGLLDGASDGGIDGVEDGSSDGAAVGEEDGAADGAEDGAIEVDGVSEGALDVDGAADTVGPAEGAPDNDGSEEIEGASEIVGAFVDFFFDFFNLLLLPDK